MAAPRNPATTTSPWVAAIATGIGAAMGSAAVHGMSPETAIRFGVGAAVGAIAGALVYRFAKRRSHERAGNVALLACIAAGAIGGLLLAVPTALVFYFVVRGKPLAANA